MKNKYFITVLLLIILPGIRLIAQIPQQIGTIYNQNAGTTFALFNNNAMVQIGNPANTSFVARDPSGVMNLLIPSAQPNLFGYFLDWQNRLVYLDRTGYYLHGFCQCPQFTPPPLQSPVYNQNIGVVISNQVLLPIPTQIADAAHPFGNVMITSEANATQCYSQSMTSNGLNRQAFIDCMLPKLAGQKEMDIYNCVRNSATDEQRTLCLLEKLGGAREQAIANQLNVCYQNYGTDYAHYPLCLAGQQMGNGELAKIVRCIEQQSRTGKVDFLSTAVCYGAQSLDLNTETQIVIACAMASGGNGYAFAGCAGGQLLSSELDKCLTDGVGGSNGCFGANNSLKKGFEDATAAIQQAFPGNPLVKHWSDAVRDLTIGPGPNNTAVKTVKNISNEIGRGTNNVGKAIKKVTPRIKF